LHRENICYAVLAVAIRIGGFNELHDLFLSAVLFDEIIYCYENV